jgi:hypothetical protein
MQWLQVPNQSNVDNLNGVKVYWNLFKKMHIEGILWFVRGFWQHKSWKFF